MPPLADTSHVLVVGLGTIGARVAAMAAGLGMRVTGVRRHVDAPAPAGVATRLPGRERLREALADADVVVLALPQTDETRAIIGAAELARDEADRRSSSTSRAAGWSTTTRSSRRSSAGRIAGAGLDAFAREPLPADTRSGGCRTC